MATSTDSIEQLANQDYKYGFVTEIDAEAVPAGLNEEIIRIISDKKGEPEWLLEWRLKAFRFWQTMAEPAWHNVHFPAGRLPEHHLLLGAEAEAGAGEPRRPRSGRSRRPSTSSASPSRSRR